jgi:high affinity Mn2+ porin
MRGLRVIAVGLILSAGGACAADLSAAQPTKAPPPAAPAAYDWTGFYLGGHVGYALGGSNWSSTQAGVAAPAVTGAFDFSNAYNFSTGNGSYFLGFQAGYDYMIASRWLFGIQTDISFPSFVGGNRTFSSVPTGIVNNLERVEFSGNVLGRVGYAWDRTLFYVAGGYAGGDVHAGAMNDTAFGLSFPGSSSWQSGYAVGGGIEYAVTNNISVKGEYLFSQLDGKTYYAGSPDAVKAGLDINTFKLGVNYKF